LTEPEEVLAFRDELLARGLLVASELPGLYGYGATFEALRLAIEALVTRAAAPEQPDVLRFPPLLPRRQLEATDYLENFPHLAGGVVVVDEAHAQHAHERPWSELAKPSALALVPAACYPVYPAIASRGALVPGGATIDAGGAWVFRHEPSEDPTRMMTFHQRELVRIGAPEAVLAWRDGWRDRGLELLRSLGLDAHPERAADRFFGRGGRILAANQRSEELKYELMVPIAGPAPTAVASFNYHREHFAALYGIEFADRTPVHTACLGFGEERVALALLAAHGMEREQWPTEVRTALQPD
jgi:seryl-tRNA synthetase